MENLYNKLEDLLQSEIEKLEGVRTQERKDEILKNISKLNKELLSIKAELDKEDHTDFEEDMRAREERRKEDELQSRKSLEKQRMIFDQACNVAKIVLEGAIGVAGICITIWGTNMCLEFDKNGEVEASTVGKYFLQNMFKKK